jgi:branched-subunit amino acid aminotransferase/4-amino-4-deoxychorismate lyase
VSIVWLNGELLPDGEARIPALDRGVLWGYGLFETMRAYSLRIWAFDDHDQRLRRGGELIDLAVPDRDTLAGALEDVLRANTLNDGAVRITLTKGAGPADPHDDATGPPNAIVTAWPLRDYTELYENGAALIKLPGGGRPLAGVKTTSYAASVVGRVTARRAGADDGLFVSPDGRALEATGSNLFVVRDGNLSTPPLDDAILPGVTRKLVLDVARGGGMRVVEEPVHVADLFSADEVLLTSSLREVYPVRSVDGREVRRGPMAEKLRDAYHDGVLEALF